MNPVQIIVRWKFPLVVGILLSLLYLHYFENRAVVEFEITVSQRSWFTFYWAGEDEGYSRWREVRTRLSPEQKTYRFYTTDFRKIKKLRIDTHDYAGEAILHKLVIYQKGCQPIDFVGEEDFSRLIPLNQIESFTVDERGLKLVSTGNDPQLELLVQLHREGSGTASKAGIILAIFLVVFLFFYFTEGYRDEMYFVPLFFTAAFILILVMASISKQNNHPDEYVHRDAGEYYQTNWVPPAVDDPEIAHTYSVYGVSRLNSQEISYLFIGKLSRLVSSLNVSNVLSLRMFNVLIFGVILLYLLKSPNARIMAIPFLLSPQLWYVFSYCNSDAFALFISFLVACQLALSRSLLNRYLLGDEGNRNIIVFLLLGFFCALLFLLKKNYLVYIGFLVAYVGWRVLFRIEQQKRRLYLKRLVAIVLVGLSLAAIRLSVDYMVNGMDRTAKMERIREELANYPYKPSTPLEDQHIFLNRKAHGASLESIIVLDRWFEKTFRSAFGLYGYLSVVASDTYYNCVRYTGGALLALMAVSIVFRGGISGNLLFAAFLACSGALIAVSLYHSWTADYQTQGRYLFPIFPMACVVLYHSRNLMQGALFKLFFTAMFLLSVYSFVFVGLFQLPKV